MSGAAETGGERPLSSAEPQPCAKGCGFFGCAVPPALCARAQEWEALADYGTRFARRRSPASAGYCSKCYKEVLKANGAEPMVVQPGSEPVAKAPERPDTASTAVASAPELAAAPSTAGAGGAGDAPGDAPVAQANTSRCYSWWGPPRRPHLASCPCGSARTAGDPRFSPSAARPPVVLIFVLWPLTAPRRSASPASSAAATSSSAPRTATRTSTAAGSTTRRTARVLWRRPTLLCRPPRSPRRASTPSAAAPTLRGRGEGLRCLTPVICVSPRYKGSARAAGCGSSGSAEQPRVLLGVLGGWMGV